MGLLLGKPIGITLASYLAVRTGAADVPRDASWRHILGVSCLGGIGFTMSLLIANLAFGSSSQLDVSQLDVAKVAVLGASTLAGVIGFGVLRSAGSRN